jgi:predicted SAM-dependent methyltransferase
MVWKIDNPQGNEAAKVKYEVVEYTRGRGLDLGCGPFKLYSHFTGVDNGHHWGTQGADIVQDCETLDMFASQSCDFVFSSHLLEHIEDYKAALKEWWRVIKPGGHLILYLPHKRVLSKCRTGRREP